MATLTSHLSRTALATFIGTFSAVFLVIALCYEEWAVLSVGRATVYLMPFSCARGITDEALCPKIRLVAGFLLAGVTAAAVALVFTIRSRRLPAVILWLLTGVCCIIGFAVWMSKIQPKLSDQPGVEGELGGGAPVAILAWIFAWLAALASFRLLPPCWGSSSSLSRGGSALIDTEEEDAAGAKLAAAKSEAILASAAAGTVMTAIAGMGLYIFNMADWFNDPGPYAYQSWVGYTPRQFVGLALFSFLTPPAFTLLFVAMQTGSAMLGRLASSRLRVAVVVVGIAALITMSGLGWTWANQLLRCGAIGCLGTKKWPVPEVDFPEAGTGWKTVIGAQAFFCAVPLIIALASALYLDFKGKSSGKGASKPLLSAGTQDTSGHVYRHNTKWMWAIGMCCLAVMVGLFISTTIIPDSWEYFTPNRIASYAVIPVTHNLTRCKDSSHYSCPEFKWAYMFTMDVTAGPDAILHVFPGNLLFYLYLAITGLAGLTVQTFRPLQQLMDRKVRTALPSLLWKRVGKSQAHFLTLSFRVQFYSVGEILMILATAFLVIMWCIYWFHDHNFNTYWGTAEALASTAEVYARSFGQLAVLLMSLLFFPAARTSVLRPFFGASWEASIGAHRVLGTLFMVAAICHMAFNYKWFDEVGIFPDDLLAVPMHLASGIDNFTVPMATLVTWLSLILIGVLAMEPVRRLHFELFYYAHHLSICMMIPMVLWHAASGWEFLLPGLIVWFTDRSLRAFRSQRKVEWVQVDVLPVPGYDVTRLRCACNFKYYPGQYCFINIPELSIFEWHPFTIASASATELEFDIKGMGMGTWSQRLFDLVSAGKQVTVTVDGPYGTPIDFSEYDVVLLAAGGIGITPCKSIFAGLRQQHDSGEANVPSKTHLVWTARDPALFTLMQQELNGVNPTTGAMSAELFSSAAKNGKGALNLQSVQGNGHDAAVDAAMSVSDGHVPETLGARSAARLAVSLGRPDMHQRFCEVNDACHSRDRTLLFVCGPGALVDDMQALAYERGWTFHNETFEL
eukprot:m.14595 g.14595  ORF g.14595 m.14595 type:complete len:1020 (+) comp4851_c0_seq2:172-3231(+)